MSSRWLLAITPLLFIFGCERPAPSAPKLSEEQQREAQVRAQLSIEKSIPDAPPAVDTYITGTFTPPDGKLLLFIGQDSETISDYVEAVPQDSLEGVTLYTQIYSNNVGTGKGESLAGLFGPADWGAGINDYPKTLAESPNAALAVGLSITDAFGEPRCQNRYAKDIAEGKYDNAVDTMVNYFKDLAPRKVFLRIGYEFDGLWNCYQPEPFKAAFRHIHGRIQALEASNVVTVWQSAAWPSLDREDGSQDVYDLRRDDIFELWYPGDDVVDWAGVSIFYRDLLQWDHVPLYTPAAAQEKLLNFARERNKPVLVAEAAPQAFNIGNLSHGVTQMNNPIEITAQQLWNGWFASFFGYVYQNRDVIRAVAYINANWASQPMWHCAPSEIPKRDTCGAGNWGDSRVQANDYILGKWLEQIHNEKVWIQTSQYD